jgi:hypothetical protein
MIRSKADDRLIGAIGIKFGQLASRALQLAFPKIRF